MTWTVEHLVEGAAEFHARNLPDPVTRHVWVCAPTQRALVLGSAQGDAADRAACAAAGVAVVRRRSGGGAVLVQPGVLWVDVLLPAVDPLWEPDVGQAFLWLGEVWARALDAVGLTTSVHRGPLVRTAWSELVCFAGLGPGELTDRAGRKVLGMSQRRTRAGARFQCAVLEVWDPDEVLGLLDLPSADRERAAADLAGAAVGVGDLRAELLAAFLTHLP